MKTVIAFILMALQSIAGLIDEEAAELGALVGRKFNGLVASSKTQFDDFAKARVIAFLKAAVASLESGEIDQDDNA